VQLLDPMPFDGPFPEMLAGDIYILDTAALLAEKMVVGSSLDRFVPHLGPGYEDGLGNLFVCKHGQSIVDRGFGHGGDFFYQGIVNGINGRVNLMLVKVLQYL
jgi:hypothetical protein